MKTLSLGSGTIQVTPEMEAYSSLRQAYVGFANYAKSDFKDHFFERFKDMDQLHTDCEHVAHGYIAGIIDYAIRDLVNYGIMDVDEDRFLNQYLPPHLTWTSDYHIIDDKYMEIVLSSEKLDEYRSLRRENSPGLIGGGFGIQGAAQGIAVATAANVAIGLAHGVFNLGAKALSAIGDAQNKAILFSDNSTVEHLSASIHRLVFQVHFAIVELVNSRSGAIIFDDVSEEDRATSNGLYENVKKGRIVGDKSDECLIGALAINPYEPLLYSLWFDRHGDADGRLEVVAKFFGIDSVTEHKRKLIYNCLDKLRLSHAVDNKPCLTEVEQYAHSLGVINVCDLIPDIIALTEQIDLAHRTVNGQLYVTNEEADSARVIEINIRDELIERRDQYIKLSTSNGWIATNINEDGFTLSNCKHKVAIFITTLFVSMFLLLAPLAWLNVPGALIPIALLASWYITTKVVCTTLIGSMSYVNGRILITNNGKVHKLL